MAAHSVLDFLRRITASDHVRVAPDADLLERFVAQRDETAFAGLVQRHGPMVLGVCIRVLGDTPDAEDAFQAAFLVLARRAGSVAKPELLGNWLYGVAYRTASKARSQAFRPQTQAGHEPATERDNPAEDAARRELRHVLDRELSRLPDRYRAPLVLHYLEGCSQEEVARRLACPRQTVTTRLARACARLQVPLARRGLALTAGGLAAALSDEASAALPAALFHATARAATLFAADQVLSAHAAGVVSARVLSLAQGIIHTMFWTKLRTVAAVLLAVMAIGAGGLTIHGLVRGAQSPVASGQRPPGEGTLGNQVLLAGAATANATQPPAKEQAVVALRELGAEVKIFEDQTNGKITKRVFFIVLQKEWKGGDAGLVHLKHFSGPLDHIDLRALNVPVFSDKGLEHLKGLNVYWLTLYAPQVTDRGLEYMKGFVNMEGLSISKAQITDDGLRHFRSMDKLRVLELSRNKITDQGLGNMALKDRTRLEALFLDSTRITDDGMAALAKMDKLRQLNLSGTAITDRTLAHLRDLPNLEDLLLNETAVTDAGLKHLLTIPKLKWLELRRTRITDVGLAAVKELGGVEQLFLDATSITDRGLTHLEKMTKLRNLAVPDTKVSKDGLRRLKQALPELRVYPNPNQ
jgi:RNA polymerase sigma factor (sigma-70 family)